MKSRTAKLISGGLIVIWTGLLQAQLPHGREECTEFWQQMKNQERATLNWSNVGKQVLQAIPGNSLRTIYSDFQVNDDFSTQGESQWRSDIASNTNGFTVVVWEDNRNGLSAVYAQLYNPDGSARGDNFCITSSYKSHSSFEPVTAVFEDGNFVIVWKDGTSWTIYAQCFRSDGAPSTEILKINDDPVDQRSWVTQPVITIHDQNSFLVGWTGISNIYLQKRGKYGQKFGSNIALGDAYSRPSF